VFEIISLTLVSQEAKKAFHWLCSNQPAWPVRAKSLRPARRDGLRWTGQGFQFSFIRFLHHGRILGELLSRCRAKGQAKRRRNLRPPTSGESRRCLPGRRRGGREANRRNKILERPLCHASQQRKSPRLNRPWWRKANEAKLEALTRPTEPVAPAPAANDFARTAKQADLSKANEKLSSLLGKPKSTK